MTFDELASIWHGSAEWWLKAEKVAMSIFTKILLQT